MEIVRTFIMIIATFMLVFFLCSCKMNHKVSGDVDVQVQGAVQGEIDLTSLLAYFEAYCRDLYPAYTEEQIKACSIQEYYRLLGTQSSPSN